MELTYFGHASFLLTAGDGTMILIDPFDDQPGYPAPDISPTAVSVSHEHFDHNHVATAKGKPKVLRGLTDGGKGWAKVDERLGAVRVTTVPTFHDPTKGSQRGRNSVFIYEVDGLRIVHAGDLGHTLDPDQIKAIGRPDVLMIPVGGFYTIGPQEADAVVAALTPRVVIPMHYKTEVNEGWSIGTIDEFTKGKRSVSRKGRSVTISRETLPAESEVWVLAHA
ncbi:MAG TPA: MBL fold metallo-hydrolase [bacterium]|jgi:L-ascorbate metabolism protein UlaG (beta-lactamase superfamily)|nr:MBL fold metallo-hydrolase [bacterium]